MTRPPQNRLCRWCHQPFALGKRRYWMDYCTPAHRMLDTQEATTTAIVVAGGDGHTMIVDAKVRDWPAPMLSINGGAHHG